MLRYFSKTLNFLARGLINFFQLIKNINNAIYTYISVGYKTRNISFKVNHSFINDLLFNLLKLSLNAFIDTTAIDKLEKKNRFLLVYIFRRLETNISSFLIIGLGFSLNPNNYTASNSFYAAGASEREIFDLFGIFFNNHPDLRKILSDYSYKGAPLRKTSTLVGITELFFSILGKITTYRSSEFDQTYRETKDGFKNIWGFVILILYLLSYSELKEKMCQKPLGFRENPEILKPNLLEDRRVIPVLGHKESTLSQVINDYPRDFNPHLTLNRYRVFMRLLDTEREKLLKEKEKLLKEKELINERDQLDLVNKNLTDKNIMLENNNNVLTDKNIMLENNNNVLGQENIVLSQNNKILDEKIIVLTEKNKSLENNLNKETLQSIEETCQLKIEKDQLLSSNSKLKRMIEILEAQKAELKTSFNETTEMYDELYIDASYTEVLNYQQQGAALEMISYFAHQLKVTGHPEIVEEDFIKTDIAKHIQRLLKFGKDHPELINDDISEICLKASKLCDLTITQIEAMPLNDNRLRWITPLESTDFDSDIEENISQLFLFMDFYNMFGPLSCLPGIIFHAWKIKKEWPYILFISRIKLKKIKKLFFGPN